MTIDNTQRIEHLEFLIAHMQKLYEELNKVVFRQQTELDALRNHFLRLDVGYQSLLESDRSPRTLADDRPPTIDPMQHPSVPVLPPFRLKTLQLPQIQEVASPANPLP